MMAEGEEKERKFIYKSLSILSLDNITAQQQGCQETARRKFTEVG